MKLVLRPCDEQSKPFVADSFVRSYQGGGGPLENVDSMPRARALRLWLNKRWADVRVMTGEGVPDLYLGWILVRFDVKGWPAWYIYVKHELRRQGLAREAMKLLGCKRVLLTTREWQEEWNEQAR